MMKLALGAVAALLLTASPASAHWQWTKWGMSQPEVVAGSGGKAAAVNADLLSMKGPYKVGAVEFRSVEFGFDDGRLTSVSLNADPSWWGTADSALAAQFGQAVTESHGGKTKVYVDRPNGQSVTVTDWGDGMSVIYRPLADAF